MVKLDTGAFCVRLHLQRKRRNRMHMSIGFHFKECYLVLHKGRFWKEAARDKTVKVSGDKDMRTLFFLVQPKLQAPTQQCKTVFLQWDNLFMAPKPRPMSCGSWQERPTEKFVLWEHGVHWLVGWASADVWVSPREPCQAKKISFTPENACATKIFTVSVPFPNSSSSTIDEVLADLAAFDTWNTARELSTKTRDNQ